jgi:hypothetical protein
VPETPERHGLPAEALQSSPVRRAGGLQKLDREGLFQADMDRAIDGSGGAFSEAFLQAVLLADEASGGRGDGLRGVNERLLLSTAFTRSLAATSSSVYI